MHIRIVTVDKVLYDDEIISITTQGLDGYFEILENHSPLISMTMPSRTRIIDKDGKEVLMFTSKGIMRILNNDILFITDGGELRENIDLERAKRAKASLRRAEERIKTLE